jgi:hypothetical protein
MSKKIQNIPISKSILHEQEYIIYKNKSKNKSKQIRACSEKNTKELKGQ